MESLLDLDDVTQSPDTQQGTGVKVNQLEEKNKQSDAEKLESLFGTGNDDDDFDIFGTPAITEKPRTESKDSVQSMDDFFDNLMNSESAAPPTQERSEYPPSQDDNIDDLVPCGSLGSLGSLGSYDLLSLDPFASVPSSSSSLPPSTDTVVKQETTATSSEQLDDFFGGGTSEVTETKLDNKVEQLDDIFGGGTSEVTETKLDNTSAQLDDLFGVNTSVVTDPQLDDTAEQPPDNMADTPPEMEPEPTNLRKRGMEKSFEDLLHGLSDESDLDLDDMISGDQEYSTNLESLLDSPDKSYPPKQPGLADTPQRDFDSYDFMETLASTPKVAVDTPEVRVVSPDGQVQYSDDDEEDIEDEEEDEGVEEENDNAWEMVEQVDVDDEDQEEEEDEEDEEEEEEEEEEAVVMRKRKSPESDTVDGFATRGDSLDLSIVMTSDHLDVDVSKHKSELGKMGSMANRRKQTRQGRQSYLSTGEDAIFQDSTEPKPRVANGTVDVDDVDAPYTESPEQSPPAKKPTNSMMIPLPGLSRPTSRKFSQEPMEEEDAPPPKVPKSKPPGGFKLPGMEGVVLNRGPWPNESSTDNEPEPAVFEKPPLRAVSRPDKKPDRPEVKTFEKPALKSVPKPREDDDDEEDEAKRNRVTGLFEKPQLRSPARGVKDIQKPDRKLSEGSDDEKHTFEKPVLKSTPRKLPTIPTEEKEKPVQFEKPALKPTATATVTEAPVDTNQHRFEKPVLRRSPSKDVKEPVGDDSSSHTFEKPVLRSSPAKHVVKTDSVDTETASTGIYEKPALRRTPSSERLKTEDNSQKEKGVFEKPSLRQVGMARTSPDTDSKSGTSSSSSSSHFGELKLRKTKVVSDEPKALEKDTPIWLQAAKEKRTKALDVIQTKENQNQNSNKSVPSWLENSPLKKNPVTLPLQEASMNGSSNNTNNSDDIYKSAERKSRSSFSEETPRALSIDRDRDEIKSNFRKASPRETANYTPSWMKNRSPLATGLSPIGPSKSMPALNDTEEVPQWKKDLALRRKAKKESPSTDSSPKVETAQTPEWVQGGGLRKLRTTTTPGSTKESASKEPEWLKSAEEKKARLRKPSLDKSTAST